MQFIKSIISIVICTLAVAHAAPVFASNKDVIKHRQGVMKAIGGHFGALFATRKGMEQYQGDRVMHADMIAMLAKISITTFPEGSGDGKTAAKPEVWSNADAFKKEMDKFLDKTDTLAKAAKADDAKAYNKALLGLGGSCKSCHDDYVQK